jgi:alpha-L-rhamnosidase
VDGDKLTMEIEIPVNTTATIYIPATDAAKVSEGGKLISTIRELELQGKEDEYVVVKTGSGKYVFTR